MANPEYGYHDKRLQKPLPPVAKKRLKQKAEKKAWRKTAEQVDERDDRVCFVTGKWLTAGSLDPWLRFDRAHLRARSVDKARRYVSENVVSMAHAVHRLFDGHCFWLLDKKGRPATSAEKVDHFAWNRNRIPKGEEPFTVRKGLAVRKDA